MSLQCNHAETDTRPLLNAKASCDEGNFSIVLACEDNEVFILAISYWCVTKEIEHFTL